MRFPAANRFSGISIWSTSALASALAATTIGAATFSAQPAHAQFFDYGYSDSYVKPRKKPVRVQTARRKPSVAETEAKKRVEAVPQPVGPLVINVSIRKQRVSVYDANGLVTEAPISSGRVGHPTPTGIFSILEKNRVHYSNLYDSAPMPNMQRITWSGVALHAGDLPGYPASHGCIRLPHSFSKRLFEITKMGTRVIVSNEPVVPQSFRHDTLFAAHPTEATVTHAVLPQTGTRVADATETGSIDSVLGVSHAAAATTLTDTDVRSKVEAIRAARKTELQRLDEIIANANVKKEELTAKAKDAVAVADAQRAAHKIARKSWLIASQGEKKARNAQADAEERLEQFGRRLLKRKSVKPAETEALQKEEDNLETAVLDLADATAAASRQAAIASDALAAVERMMAETEDKRQRALNELHAVNEEQKKAVEAQATFKRREAKRNQPVHVFVSRKTGKIYARQGYEPILEAPITIENPDQAIGTHVFTALTVDAASAAVTWNAVSVPTLSKPLAGPLPKNKAQREAALAAERHASLAARTEQTAEHALKRITIPDDVRAEIEDVMKPGSSLIISDNGASNETGKYTDFIVSIR